MLFTNKQNRRLLAAGVANYTLISNRKKPYLSGPSALPDGHAPSYPQNLLITLCTNP